MLTTLEINSPDIFYVQPPRCVCVSVCCNHLLVHYYFYKTILICKISTFLLICKYYLQNNICSSTQISNNINEVKSERPTLNSSLPPLKVPTPWCNYCTVSGIF